MQKKLISLDIETECAKAGCTESDCDHALVPHLSRITIIALAWEGPAGIETKVIHDHTELRPHIEGHDLCGHNLKFDLKTLITHGHTYIKIESYKDDTSIMATAAYEKVTPKYLEWYERERRRLNKDRKIRGHRKAGQHSLKTCAPYYLKVAPFWEPENHDNADYVTKDAVYSLQLRARLYKLLEEEGTLSFYQDHLMPWSRMFLRAELRGVLLDLPLIAKLGPEYEDKAVAYKQQLERLWAEPIKKYQEHCRFELSEKYRAMYEAAVAKSADKSPEKLEKLRAKYQALRDTAAAKADFSLNYNSPPQLKWLLKEGLGLDITGLDGEESTDKEVLELLVGKGRTDVEVFLKYREATKIVGTYFKSYKELADSNGVIHGSFNLDIARTGRTSSSMPNLQNQPRELHEVFIARPGYVLITKDLSAIEPSVVAFYSEDPLLVDLIKSGGDFHGYNCNAILGTDWDLATLKKLHPEERDLAKEVGLAVLYGAGRVRIYACSTKRGFKLSLNECAAGVERLREAWPDVVAFKRSIDQIADTGEPITNFFGRKRVFEEDEVYMKAFNSLIQGTASDLLLESTRQAQDEFDKLGIDAHLLMTVHDEVIFEVPENLVKECDDIITKNMTKWKLPTPMGDVPLRVEGKASQRWEK